jgi:2-polyprenyl-6-methoxyphenol hydroxylase-like FAD-dependent oxidoreductase
MATVLIAGGGIAGAAAALALHQAFGGAASQLSVIIAESRTQEECDNPTGSYLCVASNGLAALSSINAGSVLANCGGVVTRHNRMYNDTGALLAELTLGEPAATGSREYGDVPAVSMLRWGLSSELVALAKARLGSQLTVRYGCKVSSVTESEQNVTLTCADGTAITGDVLLGCDGLHSQVRRQLVDPKAPAHGEDIQMMNFGGRVRLASAEVPNGLSEAHIAAIDAAGFERRDCWHMIFGRQAFFGFHWTVDASKNVNGMAWFVNNDPASINLQAPPTTDLEQLQQLFVADGKGELIRSIIGASQLDLARHATCHLPRVAQWTSKRCVLVGDAVHAPSPSSGQGASMALEDAVFISLALRDACRHSPEPGAPIPAVADAAALKNSKTLAVAFDAYVAERKPRVEKIVDQGKRSSGTKSPGSNFARWSRDWFLRNMLFKHIVTPASQHWVFGYRIPMDGVDVIARREAQVAASANCPWWKK